MKSELASWLIASILVSLTAPGAEKSSAPAVPRKYSIQWIADAAAPGRGRVEVAGFAPGTLERISPPDNDGSGWQRVLSVQAELPDGPPASDLPGMNGVYMTEQTVLRFTPEFPLTPGLKYRAVLHTELLADPAAPNRLAVVFGVPQIRREPTTFVREVYPTADLLPENLLKFYVHFSAPMSRGHIYDYIHLRDQTGRDVELPFLEIDEELWDPTMTRLTLFIDPGRIKRGVRPLEEVGPALEAGKRYALVIDKAWQDATLQPLKKDFRKSFRVGPPDRDPPDPARWKLGIPKAETRDLLRIDFQEPIDEALAQRFIRVAARSGAAVEGKITLANGERRWMFAPTEPWRVESYQLVIATTLEDLAGNNIGKPFDVDVFETVQPRLTNTTVILPVEIR